MIQKGIAASEIIINTAKGVVKAIGEGNYAQAAIMTAIGTVQLAKVIGETIKGFLTGGYVGMTPGSATGQDHQFIAVDGEEYVLPTVAVKKIIREHGTEALENLRRGMLPNMSQIKSAVQIGSPSAGFFAGGPVTPVLPVANAIQAQAQPVQPQPIINVIDQSMFARMMGTKDGKRAFINFITDNAPMVRQALAP